MPVPPKSPSPSSRTRCPLVAPSIEHGRQNSVSSTSGVPYTVKARTILVPLCKATNFVMSVLTAQGHEYMLGHTKSYEVSKTVSSLSKSHMVT